MADCFSVTSLNQTENKLSCPTCEVIGKSVLLLTIRALTRRDFSKYGELRDGMLCSNPDDDTVYYFVGGGIIVKRDDLITPYHLKEENSFSNVCYCFQYSKSQIQEDILSNSGISMLKASIRENIKKKLCTCEVSNPTGKCCLGEISKIVKEFQQKSSK